MPRRLLRWASYRVGNRGVVAFILGFIWFLIGASLLVAPPPAPLPDKVIPAWIRAVAWMVTGAFAMGWQLVTPARKHDDHNVWGLLMIMPAARFFTLVAAGIIDMFHFHGLDYQATWLGAAVWVTVVALIDRCAVGLDRLPPVRLSADLRRRWWE